VLKPGGRAAFIASGAQAPKPNRDDVTSLRPPVVRARQPFERIAQLFAAGALRPPEINSTAWRTRPRLIASASRGIFAVAHISSALNHQRVWRPLPS